MGFIGFLIVLVLLWAFLAFAWMFVGMVLALVNALFKDRLAKILNWWMDWGEYLMFQKPLFKK